MIEDEEGGYRGFGIYSLDDARAHIRANSLKMIVVVVFLVVELSLLKNNYC